MKLFDTDKISANLLAPEKIKWFSDIPRSFKDIPAAVMDRLSGLAKERAAFSPPDYGDSYGEYFRNGNRCNFEDMYINRRAALADLAFYEIFSGSDEYTDKIEALIRLICSEDTWCVPAHSGIKPANATNHVIELYSSETASVLCTAYRFLHDRLSPDTLSLIRTAVRERIFIPYTETDDYRWMGSNGEKVNNWNPWINSNIIFCSALICADMNEYSSLVVRACSFTENYLRSISDDCLCDEGVRYWNLSGACLFDIAELIYDITGGKTDITGDIRIKNACAYPTGMYDEYGNPANYADAGIDFYPDCPLLIRAGKRTGNALLFEMGRTLYRPERLRTIHDNFYRQLKDILTAPDTVSGERVTYPESMFLKGISVCTLRKNGFFASLKGNHNAESHNHNDAGSFVVYYKGTPLFVDPGVDLYSRYTFSDQRYKLWYMSSDYHNLPVINGRTQKNGRKYTAAPMKTGKLYAETDIAGAYGYESDFPCHWIRRLSIDGGTVEITDRFDCPTENTRLHYITRELPEITGNRLIFSCGVTAELIGIGNIYAEELNLTCENPPNGIKGDAENRHPDPHSLLIPRLLEKQWGQKSLWRIVCTPICGETVLKIYPHSGK